MSSDADLRARQLASEIDAFAGRGIPAHSAAVGWRNVKFLGPLMQDAFGRQGLHAAYATCIADAIRRTGNPTVFSLGCGEGPEELIVLQRADEMGLPPFRIIGLELSPITGARAMAAAEAAGLADRFRVEVCDLNAGLPGEGPVAAVMAHHTLHHIVELEPLFDSIAARLEPEGSFVTFDMIGRNGHRRWPEIMGLLRRIWPHLPPDKHHDHVFQRPMRHFLDWDCSIQGFEGIRSQDILRLLAERFDVARFIAWGGLSEVFLSYRTGPGFDPELEADREFLTRIQLLETRLLEERRTTPTEMGAEFRSRRSTFQRDPALTERMRRAVREPGEVFAALDDIPFASPYPPQPPAVLPVLAPNVDITFGAGTAGAQALIEGFDEPDADGVWALLDEQILRFRLKAPARSVAVKVWSFLPAARRQAFRAEAADCAPASSGPVAPEKFAELVLTSRNGPRMDWEIRILADAYRLPDLEGGPDIRPLAYRLASLRANR